MHRMDSGTSNSSTAGVSTSRVVRHVAAQQIDKDQDLRSLWQESAGVSMLMYEYCGDGPIGVTSPEGVYLLV